MIKILQEIREKKARRVLDAFLRNGLPSQALPEDDRMVPLEMYDAICSVLKKSQLTGSDEYACVAARYSERYDEVYLRRMDR